MGELTRQHDWSATPIGMPDQWPQSLRVTLGILLNTRFPMLLFWGPELIQFYNDAFRPSFGNNGKHPAALGQRGVACWTENWTIIKPLLDQVLGGGEAVWNEDQLVPIYRNNRIEEAYWTFSYSPVKDESGTVAGILVTCTETTKAVLKRKESDESQRQILDFFEQSPVAIAIISEDNLTFRIANPLYGHLVGRTPDELIGKPLLEALPELQGQGFDTLLREVIRTGKPFIANEMSVDIVRHNQLETIYVDLTYQPQRATSSGIVSGILVVATDVTQQVRARQKIEESEARFRSLIEQAPVATCLFVGRDMRVDVANQLMINFWGKGWSVIGKPLIEAIPELNGQPFLDILDEVYTTGISYIAQGMRADLEVDGVPGTYYFDFTYKPIRNADGEVYAVMDMAIDVTAQVMDRLALEESEARFRSLIEEAPVATMLLVGHQHTIELANEKMIQMLGKGRAILGQAATAAVPELAVQTYIHLLDTVFTSGIAHEAQAMPGELWVNGIATLHYFDFTYKPLRNPAGMVCGILSMAVDVTEQVLARQKLEDTISQIRSLVESAPFPIGVYTGREMCIELANQAIIDVYGKGPDVIGKLYPELLPELATQGIFDQLRMVYDTGVAFNSGTRRVDIEHQGKLVPYYFNYNFTPLSDAVGRVYGVMNTAADVTALELARQQVEETATALRNAVELAELGHFSVNVATSVITVSPRVADWFGFENLSADAETFIASVGKSDRDRVRSSLFNTLLPGANGRYDVVHSVIHARTGRRRILHALGQVYLDTTGQSVRIEGTVQDITSQQELQVVLEQQVQQRTEELAAVNVEIAASNEEYAILNEELEEANQLLSRSNENLQQFAYIASHDLQEPLRKIQQFGDLLKTRYTDTSGDELTYLERMQSAASRMSILIRDLLSFSRISTQRDASKLVSLNEVISTVLTDLELTTTETGADVRIGTLPTILGDPSQLGQLFQNLLSNALKFHQPAVAPVIQINAHTIEAVDLPLSVKPTRMTQTYHRIDVADNGIGFDEKYLDRIFQVFQRLHSRSEFTGTGIGLAICEKVVTNHGGAITAASQPGQGATFSIYLPT